MFGNIWWIFGFLVFIIDFVNPFVGLFGNLFNIVFMFILTCNMIVVSVHRKKLGRTAHLKPLVYITTGVIWIGGIIIRPIIFSVASGFLTDIRKPAGIVFLWPQAIEFQMSLLLTVVSMIFHTLMCISIIAKMRKG